MEEPIDPFSEIGAGAISHHELYSAWVEAGFTPNQAMDLVKMFLSEVIRAAVST